MEGETIMGKINKSVNENTKNNDFCIAANLEKNKSYSQTEDACEYLELLNGLTLEEKREVKGIMTGMKVMKSLLTT